MGHHLIVETQNESSAHPLGVFTSLGRDPSNSIRLRDTHASRQHCVIERSSDYNGYLVRDLGSSSGTFVNGERVYGQQRLRHGDRIGVGNTLVRFSSDALSEHPPMAPAQDERSEPPMVLRATQAPAPASLPVSIRASVPAPKVAARDLLFYPNVDPTATRVLLAVRDAEACTQEDLQRLMVDEALGTTGPASELNRLRAISSVDQALGALQELGLVALVAGKYETTPRLNLLQVTLGLSLKSMLLQGPSKVLCAPIFGEPKGARGADVFVLMPFAEELRRIYSRPVSGAAQGLGLSVNRADNSPGMVMDSVWSGICHAKVIVADCTGSNPNVFYEIGLAHALGKKVILICQQRDEVPFDLRHQSTIEYKDNPEGWARLETGLRHMLEECLELRQSLASRAL